MISRESFHISRSDPKEDVTPKKMQMFLLKNNMKGKDRRHDKWLSQIRAPFESIFSKQEKRARYRGIAKVQMQAFLEAIVFNVKRLIAIDSPPLFAGA